MKRDHERYQESDKERGNRKAMSIKSLTRKRGKERP